MKYSVTLILLILLFTGCKNKVYNGPPDGVTGTVAVYNEFKDDYDPIKITIKKEDIRKLWDIIIAGETIPDENCQMYAYFKFKYGNSSEDVMIGQCGTAFFDDKTVRIDFEKLKKIVKKYIETN